MISAVFNFLEQYSLIINFICHVVIFLGGFYVAMHSRVIPKWASTSIWYIGLSSFFVGITIVIEWIFGELHPLSHFMMGHAAEILMNLNLAVLVALLFFHTAYRDYIHRKKRDTPNMDKMSL